MADDKTTVKLNVDGHEHEVETKPVTLIAHNGTMNIKPLDADILEISPETTVKRADELSPLEWDELKAYPQFMELWSLVYTDTPPPQFLNTAMLGMRHVVGLILLFKQAIYENKRPFVRLPESYLHPRQQSGLADLFIRISGAGK
jgi:hypothetical protein